MWEILLISVVLGWIFMFLLQFTLWLKKSLWITLFTWINFYFIEFSLPLIIVYCTIISLYITIVKNKRIFKEKTPFYAILIYSLLIIWYSVFFLFNMEWLKSGWTTWWNFALGLSEVLAIIMILIYTIVPQNLVLWYSKLFIWIIHILLIWKFGFPESYWVWVDEIHARWTVILISLVFMVEWMIMIMRSDTPKIVEKIHNFIK